MPTKRIYWSPAEEDLVISDAAFEMVRNGVGLLPSDDDREGTSLLLESIRAAQGRMLTADRRRPNLISRQNFREGFLKKLAEALKNPPKSRPDPFWITHRPDLESIPEVVVPNTGVSWGVPDVKPSPEPKTSDQSQLESSLKNCSDAELFREFFDRMFNGRDRVIDGRLDALEEKFDSLAAIVGTIQKQLSQQTEYQSMLIDDVAELTKRITRLEEVKAPVLQPLSLPPPREVTETAIKKHRVAIVACQRTEFDRIVAGAINLGLTDLDFRHYDQDENPKQIHADYVLLMKWASHKWNDQVKNAVPNSRIAFIGGGTTMALKQLATWFSN